MHMLDKIWKKSSVVVKVIIHTATDLGSITEVTFLQG